MKKILISLTAFVLFTSFQSNNSAVVVNSSANDKVTICHRTGNGSSHAITVSKNAVQAHLDHGDKLGNCENGGG